MLNNFTGSEVFGTSLLNDFIAKLNQEFGLHMKIGGTEYTALVSSINTKNSSQDTEINNIKTAATALTSRVGTAETNINTLSTNLTNLTSSHNGLNSTVGGISTSLGNVQSKVTTLETEVSNVKTRVGNLETNVGLLQGRLGDVDALIQQKVSEANQSTMGYIDALREEKTDVGHQHAWTDLISGIPVTATRWPTWDEITSKVEATTTVPGMMSAADKTKLNGIATGANNYSHPTGDGNLHVPATSTTNNKKALIAGATAGSVAWNFVSWNDLIDKPTAMPASDVSAWAKAGTKPTYTPSEVGAYPSTGGVLGGNATFNGDFVLEWVRNTDYSRIGFKNTGDSDADSYMYFETGDNNNEFFKWRGVSAGPTYTDYMTLKHPGVLNVLSNITINGSNVYHEGRKPTWSEIQSKPSFVRTDIESIINSILKFSSGGTVGGAVFTETSIVDSSGLDLVLRQNQGSSWSELRLTDGSSGGFGIKVRTSIDAGANWTELLNLTGNDISYTGKKVYHEGKKPTFSEIGSKPTTVAGYGITDSFEVKSSAATDADGLVLKGSYLIADTEKSYILVQSTRTTGTEITPVTQIKVPTEGTGSPAWRRGSGNPIVWEAWKPLGGISEGASIDYNSTSKSIDFNFTGV